MNTSDDERYHRVQPIHSLRRELLYTGTSYGVAALIDGGGRIGTQKWRDWLEYEKTLTVRVAVMAAEFGLEGPHGESPSSVADTANWMSDPLREYEVHGRDPTRGAVDAIMDRHRWELLERLADRGRAVEELGGEPLNEVKGEKHPYGVALLGAVQDSLI